MKKLAVIALQSFNAYALPPSVTGWEAFAIKYERDAETLPGLAANATEVEQLAGLAIALKTVAREIRLAVDKPRPANQPALPWPDTDQRGTRALLDFYKP